MVLELETLMQIIGLLVTIIGLWSAIEWRSSIKRNLLFKKMDALREHVKEDYVRKDIHDISQRQQDHRITDLKEEIDQIKVKTEMIPQIQSDVKEILTKLSAGRQ